MPTMKEIRDIARQLGIRSDADGEGRAHPGHPAGGGNFDCFGTAAEESAARRSASGGRVLQGVRRRGDPLNRTEKYLGGI